MRQPKFARWLLYPGLVVLFLAVVSVSGPRPKLFILRTNVSSGLGSPGPLVDGGEAPHLHLHWAPAAASYRRARAGRRLSSSTMGWIPPVVARDTRVCVYDRAGHRWGDPTDAAQDAPQIATDLHTPLQRANVPGPYVLAGHSFGGSLRTHLRRPVSHRGCRHCADRLHRHPKHRLARLPLPRS